MLVHIFCKIAESDVIIIEAFAFGFAGFGDAGGEHKNRGSFMLIFLEPYRKASGRTEDGGKIGKQFGLIFLDVVDNGRTWLGDDFFAWVFCHILIIDIRAYISTESDIIDTAVSVHSEQREQSFPSTIRKAGADRGGSDKNHFFFAFKVLCERINMVVIVSGIMAADFNTFTAVDAGIGVDGCDKFISSIFFQSGDIGMNGTDTDAGIASDTMIFVYCNNLHC